MPAASGQLRHYLFIKLKTAAGSIFNGLFQNSNFDQRRYWQYIKSFVMLSTISLKASSIHLIASTVFLFSAHFAIAQDSSACKLLQPSELESALGGKAGKFSDYSTSNGHICSGAVGKLKVMIRVAPRTDQTGAKEEKGVEMLRKQGWEITVKKEGSLTCSTAIPPAAMAQAGYTTTASIFSKGKVVAIDVSASSKDEMVSINVVRDLVQKAFPRL